MAILLDGKLLSEALNRETAQRIAILKEKNITPGLAVILIGDDPASQTYVRSKAKACDALGIYSKTVLLDKDVPQSEVESLIAELNQDPQIDGILLQLPVPAHLDEQKLLSMIDPDKDVDGFHPVNAGKLLIGRKCVVPCTPAGMLYMLDQAGIELSGKHAVVIGRSNIVGKPAAMLLLHRNCTVTICHSKTHDLPAITRQADILVAAVGKPGFVTADMVKDGAVVLDVGINRVDGHLCGDVDFDAVSRKASYITPVPGGVGKMTIAMLMSNTVLLAENRG